MSRKCRKFKGFVPLNFFLIFYLTCKVKSLINALVRAMEPSQEQKGTENGDDL